MEGKLLYSKYGRGEVRTRKVTLGQRPETEITSHVLIGGAGEGHDGKQGGCREVIFLGRMKSKDSNLCLSNYGCPLGRKQSQGVVLPGHPFHSVPCTDIVPVRRSVWKSCIDPGGKVGLAPSAPSGPILRQVWPSLQFSYPQGARSQSN